MQYLVALLSPVFQPDTACLLSAQRALRISHVWEDILCVWRPKIDVLQSLSAPLRAQDTRPALLIQVLDSGDTEWLDWLGKDKHNYGHLLRVTIPRNPALLVVKATLKDLAAYSADFVFVKLLTPWLRTFSHGRPQLPLSTCSQLSNCLWQRPVMMVPSKRPESFA